jgi:hypothetical protein
MMYPTVHLNGTSKRELIDQLCNACMAINTALSTVTDAQPNGRDYYPQGDTATKDALNEHAARIQSLVKVRDELMEIAEHIDASEGFGIRTSPAGWIELE